MAKKGNSLEKETKHERFIRLGTGRVKSILKGIRILGNCSSRSNYEYSKKEVDQMFITITTALSECAKKFHSKEEKEEFEFKS